MSHAILTTEKEAKSIQQINCRIHLKPSIVTFNLSSSEKTQKQNTVQSQSQQKYNYFVETKRLTNVLQDLLNRTITDAVKAVQSRARIKSINKGTEVLAALKIKKQNYAIDKIIEQGNLRYKAKSALRKISQRLYLSSIYSSARIFNKIYNTLNFTQTFYKHIKLSKINKIRKTIRAWRMFNQIKNQTFEKYSSLSKEMWNLFTKGTEQEKKNKKPNQVKNIDSITFSTLFNESQQNNKGKKDYVALKILSEFEKQMIKSQKDDIFDSISTSFFK